MKRPLRTLALPAAILLLAACNTTAATDEPTAADAPAAEAPAPSDGGAPMDDGGDDTADEQKSSGETQAEWMEEQTGESAWPMVEPGEWESYSGVRNDLTDDGLEPLPDSEMQVRLAGTECGLTSIKDAVSNPVFWDDENWVDGEPQVPEYIPAEAEPGKEFCIFTIDYRNVGREPFGTDEPAGVMLDNGEYHEQTEADHDISWTIQDYVIELNPGDEGQYRHVVSIPEGSAPAELWYPAETMMSGPEMSFVIGD